MRISLLIFICLISSHAIARVSLPHIFGDSMVLQRNMPIPVWGMAEPGEAVSVSLLTQSLHTQADENGLWRVDLGPMEAGGPYTLRVTGTNTILLTDILIGEVWLCSGQSNMAFPLKQDQAAKTAIPQADFPQIRLFDLKGSAYPSRHEFSTEQLQNLRSGNYYLPTVWRSCSPDNAGEFSAVAYYFGKALFEQFQVPIGLVHNAIGGSGTESWISREVLDAHPQLHYLVNIPAGKTWLDLEGLHPFLTERARFNLGGWLRTGKPYRDHPFQPAYLYETGIKPLIPFAIRGVIWYQGESNSTNPGLHRHLFLLLIESWRKVWGQGDFPFLFVQLPGMGTSGGYQAARWPEFRETQQAALSLPNTGMAVSIDVGNPTNVHPADKKTVGNRLARIAKRKVYGLNITDTGPQVIGFEKDSLMLHVYWSNTSGKLMTSDGEMPKGLVLRGYTNGGQQEQLIPVTGEIQADTLSIPVPAGLVPYELKYAWAPFPICNLINSEGLPAVPFRLGLIP